MENRENQRVMLTKRLIREGLMELLRDEPIHKVSIRALCEKSGINRSTFYKYYGSQYDVLAELEDDLLGRIQRALEGGSAVSSLQRLEAVCACLEENRLLLGLLVERSADPDFPEKLFALPLIRQIVVEVMGEHYDPESRNYVYIFITSGCYRLIREWLKAEKRASPSELAALLQKLIERVCA